MLQLRKDYLTDYSNILSQWPNWDALDNAYQEFLDHEHDLSDIWNEIYNIYRILHQHDKRITKNTVFISQFYEEFLRHNHDGVETLFRDFFDSYEQMERSLSEAVITPDEGLLHLPAGYANNRVYSWTSKPFELNKDPYPDNLARVTDPQNLATRAFARIVATRQGSFEPYLVVTDNPDGANNRRGVYRGAKRGSLLSKSKTQEIFRAEYSLNNRGMSSQSDARGYHYIGDNTPDINQASPEWLFNVPFDNNEYKKLEAKDSQHLTTTEGGDGWDSRYVQSSVNIKPRPLYDSDNPLCYNRSTNTFYRFSHDRRTFFTVSENELGPVYSENLVEVAANIHPTTRDTYFLTTTVEDAPQAGYFDVFHRMIVWKSDGEFERGQRWRSARLKKFHWPRPELLVPTRLEFRTNEIILITELSCKDRWLNGKKMVNYYQDQPNYQWLPFRKLYGDIFDRQRYTGFAMFDPSVVATIVRVNMTGSMVPDESARVIRGAYSNNNRWSAMPDSHIDRFQGTNDKIYLGKSGDYLLFYQAFVPYNGIEVAKNQLYNTASFRQNDQGTEFRGIVRYHLGYSQRELTNTDMHFRANPGGTVHGPRGYIVGGSELVKQFVTQDDRILSTSDNSKPSANIRASYWVDRFSNYASATGRITQRDVTSRHIVINPFNDNSAREPANVRGNITTGVNHPEVVSMDKDGYSAIGGCQITGRDAIRTRPRDRRANLAATWTAGATDQNRAFQIYAIPIGENHAGDELKVYFSGYSEGKDRYQGVPPKGVRVHVWQYPGWQYVGNEESDGPLVTITDEETLSRNVVWVLVSSERINDKASGKVSKLHTDYVYVELVRRGYVHEYEWEDLPQGDQAAFVIECQGKGDDRGVRIHSLDSNIISSKGE